MLSAIEINQAKAYLAKSIARGATTLPEPRKQRAATRQALYPVTPEKQRQYYETRRNKMWKMGLTTKGKPMVSPPRKAVAQDVQALNPVVPIPTVNPLKKLNKPKRVANAAYYIARRDAFYAQGLNARGKPRKKPGPKTVSTSPRAVYMRNWRLRKEQVAA